MFVDIVREITDEYALYEQAWFTPAEGCKLLYVSTGTALGIGGGVGLIVALANLIYNASRHPEVLLLPGVLALFVALRYGVSEWRRGNQPLKRQG